MRLPEDAAILVAILIPSFVTMFLAFLMSGKEWKAAQDKARERRMAEHRMNARLLKLNI